MSKNIDDINLNAQSDFQLLRSTKIEALFEWNNALTWSRLLASIFKGHNLTLQVPNDNVKCSSRNCTKVQKSFFSDILEEKTGNKPDIEKKLFYKADLNHSLAEATIFEIYYLIWPVCRILGHFLGFPKSYLIVGSTFEIPRDKLLVKIVWFIVPVAAKNKLG